MFFFSSQDVINVPTKEKASQQHNPQLCVVLPIRLWFLLFLMPSGSVLWAPLRGQIECEEKSFQPLIFIFHQGREGLDISVSSDVSGADSKLTFRSVMEKSWCSIC